MTNSTNQNFQVYNASAGSGKTFTLVKEYLKILLSSTDAYRFQNVLAVTFTNKAAAEMKIRVLENLHAISEGESSDLGVALVNELGLTQDTMQQRASKVLFNILQRYGAFNITTIDSFTHRIIRNFSFDLGLDVNFEVEMDANQLLSDAVDLLISQIGSNKDLTQVLLDFALEKANDDKSWDIAMDLKNMANVLLNEDNIIQLKKLESKSLSDFNALKKNLKREQKILNKRALEIGVHAIELIQSNGLGKGVFRGNYFVKHFEKLQNGIEATAFFDKSKLKHNIENNSIYNKDVHSKFPNLAVLEAVLFKLYNESEQLYISYKRMGLVLKNLIPLATLKYINASLEDLKNRNNIRLNAEFNQMISNQIKDEPAPFIYERLGEKFRYYFIDEMQDTSALQWQNLIPLIENALVSETLDEQTGKLLVVGDAKQSIYRWRGGKAEQFIDLADQNSSSPFSIEKSVANLETNYRSYSEIIKFNNAFFSYLSSFFKDDQYHKLYSKGNRQLENSKKGGYVSLSFISPKGEDGEVLYPSKVYETIRSLRNQFQLREMCVLVRKKDEGKAVADYLTEKNIPIVSSETLLLKSNTEVQFLIHLLKYIHHSEDQESLVLALLYLINHKKLEGDVHDYVTRLISKDVNEFFEKLKEIEIDFQIDLFNKLSLYGALEYIINVFRLTELTNAYLIAFLDVILACGNKKNYSLEEFLEYWELKKDALSIAMPDDLDAVKIMTIHKSKGLEFPVVIYPNRLTLKDTKREKVWFEDLDAELYQNFRAAYVNVSKDIANLNNYGASLYHLIEQQQYLDNINLLYVAMTRASEQLYVISDYTSFNGSLETSKKGTDLFINYLTTLDDANRWVDARMEYEFGSNQRVSHSVAIKNKVEELPSKIIIDSARNNSISVVSKSAILWDTDQEKAIHYGNLIHELFSQVYTVLDIDLVLDSALEDGLISKNEIATIRKMMLTVVNHPSLSGYFEDRLEVLNEKEFLTNEKRLLKPDRVVIKDGKVIVIDYKTGIEKESYEAQVQAYMKLLGDIGYQVDKGLLVYLDSQLKIIEVPFDF
ncbi:UvrD-helicase domain-containing protein [Urechidicola sp. KH5]